MFWWALVGLYVTEMLCVCNCPLVVSETFLMWYCSGLNSQNLFDIHEGIQFVGRCCIGSLFPFSDVLGYCNEFLLI